MCWNHFICSGWVYGTIGILLPPHLLIQILQSTESLGHCWAANHTIMQWLRLHTHSKLLAHQCGAHIRWCMNHFICSGWAYGTIGNTLPWPLLTQILTVDWKLGSLLDCKPHHYAAVEAPYPSKAACTSMWSTYKVYEPLHMQWMGICIWNHQQHFTMALVDPDFDSWLKAWVIAWLQTITYHYAVVEAPYNDACT